jgi:hypothetical protein
MGEQFWPVYETGASTASPGFVAVILVYKLNNDWGTLHADHMLPSNLLHDLASPRTIGSEISSVLSGPSPQLTVAQKNVI